MMSSLPSEIVLDIFQLSSTDYDPSSFLQYSTVLRADNIAISQVCRSWREFALSSPSLWCWIDMSRVRLAREILAKRSQALPIRLYYSQLSHFYYDASLWELAVKNISRISQIHLYSMRTDSTQLYDILATDINLPALMLEEVHIEVKYNAACSRRFLARSMPALRVLDIRGGMAAAGSLYQNNIPLCLPRLTSLHIQAIFSNGVVISIHHLFSTLKDAPALRELFIVDARPQFDLPEDYDHEIHLPNLSKLTLRSCDPATMGFASLVAYLYFPSTTVVDLEVIVRSEIEELFPVLVDTYSSMDLPSTAYTLSLEALGEINTLTLQDMSGNTRAKLQLRGPIDKETFEELCHSFPLSRIQVLSLSTTLFTEIDYSAMFDRMDGVQTLFLTYCSQPILHRVLRICATNRCFVKMNKLVLRSCRLDDPQGVDVLISFASTRLQLGCPAVDIAFEDCYSREEASEALRKTTFVGCTLTIVRDS